MSDEPLPNFYSSRSALVPIESSYLKNTVTFNNYCYFVQFVVIIKLENYFNEYLFNRTPNYL